MKKTTISGKFRGKWRGNIYKAISSCLVKCVLICSFVLIFVISANISAQEDSKKTVILDTTGFWRMYQVFKPPVVKFDNGLKPVLALERKWLHEETPPPPEGWMQPDFDDSKWLCGPARIACDTEFLARLCLRGKFLVNFRLGEADAKTLPPRGRSS